MRNLYLILASWIFQLHQSAHNLRMWKPPLIPPISWGMNCPKIEKISTLFVAFHTVIVKVNLERRISFFLLEFFTTNDNNHNLASFLKIFTKPLRTINFKTTSPSIITSVSWSRSEIKTRGWRWNNFLFARVFKFSKWWGCWFHKIIM